MKNFAYFLILAVFLHLSSTGARAQIIITYAGNGTGGLATDGTPASATGIDAPYAIVTDNVGNVFFTTRGIVYKIDTSGFIYRIGGRLSYGFSGDGGPATLAEFDRAACLAIDKYDAVYIGDQLNYRIRKIDTSGIINTIAGTGTSGFSGDGGPATDAQLSQVYGIAVDDSGNVFFSDYYNSRIRKISSSGIISTVVGTGTPGHSGDGGPATAAEIDVTSLTIDAFGNMYFIEPHDLIRKVDTFGIISTIAGSSTTFDTTDGGPATEKDISPRSLTTDRFGNIYITDYREHVRKIDTAGVVTTVAGNGYRRVLPGGATYGGFGGDGGLATAAMLDNPSGVAIGPNGDIYIADQSNSRIRKVCFCGIPVAVEAQQNEDCFKLNIYPNPSSGMVTINLTGPFSMETTVTFFDLMGSIVTTRKITSKNQGELLNLPPGTYIAEIMSGENALKEKIVVGIAR